MEIDNIAADKVEDMKEFLIRFSLLIRDTLVIYGISLITTIVFLMFLG